MMKERPILFSTDMIRAILEDRKTQTRRVVTPKTSEPGEGQVDWSNFCWDGSQVYYDTCRHGHTEERKAPLPFVDGHANEYTPYEHQYLHVPFRWTEDCTIYRIYPKWDVGDRLWVRETWAYHNDHLHYKADDPNLILRTCRWKSPRFMFKKHARIWLEITGVRVERLQEISLLDCQKEGIADHVAWIGGECLSDGKAQFRQLWDTLNAKRGYGWDTNYWVWVIEFRRL